MSLKILTFSFDDCIEDDVRLVEIFNKYKLKATFNLNSARLTNASKWMYKDTKEVRHINYFEVANLYSGHEIAAHGYSHQFMEKLNENTLNNEILLDCKLLSFLFDCEIRGFAYPFGTYSGKVKAALKNSGIIYSRTVKSTYSFNAPDDFLELNPTCHFTDSRLEELADDFLNGSSDCVQLFYIWGHSYELVTDSDWERFEKLCKKISGKSDVLYLTNIGAVNLIMQAKG
ncbi:MAG: polysaccharide deacetylase family protein [Acutalibacteraceae bacterium]